MSNEPIIAIKDVTFTYPGENKPVLNNVSLAVERGSFVAILGSNGSGKSTLCKLMNGLIPHYYVGDFEGTVTVNGIQTTTGKVATLSRHVGYVYQDFENQLVRPTVLDDASFPALNYGFEDYIDRGRKALDLAGLHVDPNEFIWQLSGGQKHLLALASVLSLDPDIIIVDEPIAQLDPEHAREFYRLLHSLNKDHEKTIIVIEHHTEFIADYCDQVVLMDGGQVLWKKQTDEALQEVDELLTRHIYPPQVTEAAYKLGHYEKKWRWPITLDEAASFFSDEKLRKHRSCSNIEDAPKEELLISFNDVSFSYKTLTRQRKQVLQNLSLSIYKGENIALVGNNGAGKSSLLRLITGLSKPDSGSVQVLHHDTKKIAPEQLADVVAFIYQNPEDMFIEDSIKKDISFFLKARKREAWEGKVGQLLADFSLTELANRDGRLLSGGQQRRASLAIGVAMEPSIMLLDEPTANLDIATKKDILNVLHQVKGQVDTAIIATHDMQLVAEWATRIIVLHEGTVLHDGTRESVFTDEYLLNRAGLQQPQILQLSQRLGMPPTYSVNEFVTYRQRKEKILAHGIFP
ncbi:energy-coupling factor transporter ATPase [Halalkalibacterium halodurans]|uniref:ABC transporter ATP-binding protein n=1 Tax=Halalkalibacterium halodurans TaxID=86665 RepID=UPI002E217A1E|nr:energy-coupling factor transporter ATPase [Halalkalibacterium halodurans]MED4174831.1 energy-coupling factor transporter ATPase [Halalkalibacterium halodurans]